MKKGFEADRSRLVERRHGAAARMRRMLQLMAARAPEKVRRKADREKV